MANSVHALHHRPSLCYTDAHLVPSRMVRVAQLFVVLLQEYIDVIVLAAAVVMCGCSWVYLIPCLPW